MSKIITATDSRGKDGHIMTYANVTLTEVWGDPDAAASDLGDTLRKAGLVEDAGDVWVVKFNMGSGKVTFRFIATADAKTMRQINGEFEFEWNRSTFTDFCNWVENFDFSSYL